MARPIAPAVSVISWDDPRYPRSLKQRVGKRAPQQIQAIGAVDLLRQINVAFICSIKCPGDVILMAYDGTRALREAGISMIGGFHSPMEQECFDLLLRGKQPIIIALARALEGMKLSGGWRPAIEDHRLLVVSFCSSAVRRPTAETAAFRNQCVAAVAEHVLIAHASPGGKVDQLAQSLVAHGRSVLTFGCSANSHLIALGARPVDALRIVSLFRAR
jgi:predicted Rossmann fold nucleotide-binding protein DprA/Smf involved in DNA uptake